MAEDTGIRLIKVQVPGLPGASAAEQLYSIALLPAPTPAALDDYFVALAAANAYDVTAITPTDANTARGLIDILGDMATVRDQGLNGRNGANEGALYTAFTERKFAAAAAARRGYIARFGDGYFRFVTPGVHNRALSTWAVGGTIIGAGGSGPLVAGGDNSILQILGSSESQGLLHAFLRMNGVLVDGSLSAAIEVPAGDTALDTMQLMNYYNGSPVGKSGNFVSNIDLGSFGDFQDVMHRSSRRSAKGVVAGFLGYGMRLGTFRDFGDLTTTGNPITDAVRDNGLGAGFRSIGPGMHDRHRGTSTGTQNIYDESTDNKAYSGQVHNGKTPNQPTLDAISFPDVALDGAAGNEARRRAERAAWDAAASSVHYAPLDYLRWANTRGQAYEGGTVYYYGRGALVEGIRKGARHSAIVRMCNLRGSKAVGAITYLDCDGIHFDDDVWDSQGLGVKIEGGSDAHGQIFIKDPWFGGLSIDGLIRGNIRAEVFNAAWGDTAGAPFSLEEDLTAIHVTGASSGVKLHEVACSLRDVAAANGQKYNVVFDSDTTNCTLFSGQISSFRNGGAAFVDRGSNNIVGDGVLGIVRRRTEDEDYTVERTDRTIYVDASAGPVTITIPFYGQWYSNQPLEIVKIDSSGNAVSYKPPGDTQTIAGVNTRTLTSQRQTVSLKPLPTEWGIF